MNSAKKVMVVSRSKDTAKVMKEILPSLQYNILMSLETMSDTKSKLRRLDIDLLIVQTPVKDEMGVRSCLQIKTHSNVEILLLVKSDIYDQVVYQTQGTGICVLTLPCKKSMIYQACELLMSMHDVKEKYEKEITRLKTRIANDKIINRAKLVLVEDYHWSEEKAHKYIERMAMDTSKTRVEVARDILEGASK